MDRENRSLSSPKSDKFYQKAKIFNSDYETKVNQYNQLHL